MKNIKNHRQGGTSKIIVILGPTSSGKTSLGVRLAYKFNGEIISADSRQVYKGMDIGTGKDLGEYKLQVKSKKSKVKSIPYHLIDVVSPKTVFSLAKYQKLAYKAIDDIIKRGKTPIIVGGTGLYLQAVVDRYQLSTAKPDKKLRQELEKKTVSELYAMLKKINSKFAKKLHESDRKNKRRLIRYLEITDQTRTDTNGHKDETNGHEENTNGHENATNGHERNINDLNYEYLVVGLTWPKEVLHKRIYQRLIERLEKEDMVGEVKKLHKSGVSFKRLESFGLEYKYIAKYLQGKLDYDEIVKKLFIAIRQFAKRQISWFRRWEKQGKKINWLKNKEEAEKLVKKFLK